MRQSPLSFVLKAKGVASLVRIKQNVVPWAIGLQNIVVPVTIDKRTK